MKKAIIIIISVLIICAFLVAVAYFTVRNILESLEYKLYPLPDEYISEIKKWSEEYDVPIETICAVIYTESRFDPGAVSSAGAKGMMQITKDTFDWLLFKTKEQYTENDLLDYKINIKYGTYFLSLLYEEFGDWDTAFAAYNAGRGRVNSWLDDESITKDGRLENIPYEETAEYIEKVNDAIEKYKKLYFSD